MQGVIIAQGGSIGGWACTPSTAGCAIATTCSASSASTSTATASSRPARTRCGWSSTTTAPGSARAAPSALFLDGEQVGEGAVAATAAMIFSADDTCDVGKEGGALVAEDYPVPNDFTGEVQLGRDRRRRGRGGRRPPARARRAAPRRDGAAVTAAAAVTRAPRRDERGRDRRRVAAVSPGAEGALGPPRDPGLARSPPLPPPAGAARPPRRADRRRAGDPGGDGLRGARRAVAGARAVRAAAPTVAYALLGSSRQLIVGPEGSMSALVGAASSASPRRAARRRPSWRPCWRCWWRRAS